MMDTWKKIIIGILVFAAVIAYLCLVCFIFDSAAAEGGVEKTKRCGMCHRGDPKVTISIEIEKQDAERIYYKISGSINNDTEQGWGVFLGKRLIAKGSDIGTFDLPKDGKTYRAYWIDGNGARELISPE